MTNSGVLFAAASFAALVLTALAAWLLAVAHESTSGLLVMGAALSVLSVAGIVKRGDAVFVVPQVSVPALMGGTAILLVALIVAAILVERADDTRTRSQATTGNGDQSVSGDPIANDAERLRELTVLFDALLEVRDTTGSFPSTEGNVQTACNYPVDKLCALESRFDKQTLIDPRGEPGRYGYWYRSDGKTFTLFASLEGSVPPERACPNETHLKAEGVKNVMCIESP